MKMTHDGLVDMRACGEAVEYCRKHDTLHQAWENCERADWMIWFLRRKSLLDKPTAVKFAILCANRVIGMFERKYPDDKRPRLAIEVAQRYLDDPTEENRLGARAADAAYAAAAAAYAAAYADAAAYAAAYAAYAADAAAYAAADAADAAAYAADAAAYAADAAAYAAAAADAARSSERKWQADELRKLVPNPFDA